MRLPPHPWLCSTIGTGRSFVAPEGRKSVKQMSTGALVPGSGTLWMQPSVTFGADPSNPDRWTIRSGERVIARYATDELRLLLHWDAEVYRDLADL